MSQKKKGHCIYARCWADIAGFTQRISIWSFINSERLQSSAYMNVMCLYIPKSFQSLKHCLTAMTQLQFASLPSFFIKTLPTTLWGSSLVWMPKRRWNSCKATTSIWNNNHTHTKSGISYKSGQSGKLCVLFHLQIWKKITISAMRDLLC